MPDRRKTKVHQTRGKSSISSGVLFDNRKCKTFMIFATLLVSIVSITAASASAPSLSSSSSCPSSPMARTMAGRKSRSDVVSVMMMMKKKNKKYELRGGGGELSTPSSVEAKKEEEEKGVNWFPVRRSEVSKFAIMTAMMFLFIYVFTTAHDTKDTLVVSHCGAEAIPLLKLCGTLPCTIAFIALYSKWSTFMDKKRLFRLTLLPFFVFYAVFAFVLYPYRDSLNFVRDSSLSSPALALLRHWTFSLYFIVSELWASAGIPLLFWQCANDVTPLEQAKRFYPLFAVFGNLAPIVSGKVMSGLVSISNDNFTFVLQSLAIFKALAWFGILALHKLIYKLQQTEAENERQRKKQQTMDSVVSKMKAVEQGKRVEVSITLHHPGKKKAPPPKSPTSLKESIQSLSKSSELRSLASMVICYNICVELTEVLWKTLIRETFQSDKANYMKFMAKFSQIVGICTLLMQLMASELIGIFGWTFSALLTPLITGTLALLFFWAVSLKSTDVTSGSKMASMALLLGTTQNVVTKVFKYSLFDPCKEMAYIPLGEDAKIQGKAAVDVFGARLGRSVGSLYQQIFVSIANENAIKSILNYAPYFGVFYGVTILVWYNAVWALGKLFDDGGEKQNEEGRKGRVARGGDDGSSSSSSSKTKRRPMTQEEKENAETMAAAAAMIQDAAKRRMEKQDKRSR